MANDQLFGPNDWLVDEMYEQYRDDPESVSESWRDFFADYRPEHGDGATAGRAEHRVATTAGGNPRRQPAESRSSRQGRADPRGAAARIVANMEASLGVPTATSVRVVPAKLLEVNRTILNNYLSRTGGGKVSFTHLIGYAIVQALKAVPVMNSSFVEVDGKPRVIHHEHVGLGLAVDVEKSDGSRTLLVPCIKDADTLDFRELLGRLRGAHPQGPQQQDRRRRLRRRHRSPSPTRARSAPSTRCPASCPARASSSASAPSTTRPSTRRADPRDAGPARRVARS